MAHPVKCLVCGETFDRDKVEAVQAAVGRRYMHATCADDYAPSQDSIDLDRLHKYLQALFKKDYDFLTLDRQIKSIIVNSKGAYTYSGILKSLIYWYEVKGNSLEKAEGRIGIVPYVYKPAYDYYLAQYLANQANVGKNLDDYKNPETRVIRIKPPEKDISRFRLFDLDD